MHYSTLGILGLVVALQAACTSNLDQSDTDTLGGAPGASEAGGGSAASTGTPSGGQANEEPMIDPDLVVDGIYHVRPDGDDQAAGNSVNQAWGSIPHALNQLTNGDTLVVGDGVYYLSDPTGYSFEGLDSNWIVAPHRGGAVLTFAWPAARKGTVEWQPLGDGLYRTADPGQLHTAANWDGQFLMRLPLEALKSGNMAFERHGQHYDYDFPRQGFAVDDGLVYLRLPGDIDPNGRSIVFQRAIDDSVDGQAWLRIERSANLVLDGLVFEGVFSSALSSTAGRNDGLQVRNSEFRLCRSGLELRWSDDVLVEWNEYSFPGYERYVRQVRGLNSPNDDVPFILGKKFFLNEGGLMVVSKVKRFEARFNYAHDAFDGYSFGASDESSFHHNVAWSIGDNGIETDYAPEGFGHDMRVHHNLFVNCQKGAVSQQSFHEPSREIPGPFYLYRNVVIGYDAPGWRPWTVIKGLSHPWSGGYHVFNNTVWVKAACLFSLADSQTTAAAQQTISFRNNLLVFEEELTDCRSYLSDLPTSRIHSNLLVAKERTESVLANGGQYVTDLATLAPSVADFGFEGNVADEFDFGLSSGSPAVDAGSPLPHGLPALSARGKLDIGAVEHGRDSDEHGALWSENWPRPRRPTFDRTAPAGFEPLPF